MELGQTLRQANALKELTRIIDELSMLMSNDSFLSGQSELVDAQVMLMRSEGAWKSELENLKAEI